MKPISITDFRKQLFKCFYIAETTGAEFMIRYRSRIFKISIEDTGKKWKRKYKPRPSKINPLTLVNSKCPDCNEPMIAGVCLNPSCLNLVKH